MNNRGNDKVAFHKALQAKGWHLEDNRIYSPNGTFWIEGNADLPLHMIERMYETRKNSVEKARQSEHLFQDKEQFHNVIEDLQSQINTLKELLDEQLDTQYFVS